MKLSIMHYFNVSRKIGVSTPVGSQHHCRPRKFGYAQVLLRPTPVEQDQLHYQLVEEAGVRSKPNSEPRDSGVEAAKARSAVEKLSPTQYPEQPGIPSPKAVVAAMRFRHEDC